MTKEYKRLVCMMSGCKGTVYRRDRILLPSGCSGYCLCYPCSKCGRVHSAGGHLMFAKTGEALFLRDGSLERVLESVRFRIGRLYETSYDDYVCLEEKDDEGMHKMTDLHPYTLLVFDGKLKGMFRFHDKSGVKYLLHRGSVNGIESYKKPKLWAGKKFMTIRHVNVCLEGHDGDCVFADMVQLEPKTLLTFDNKNNDKYRFHTADGTEYHLHIDDLQHIKAKGR